MSIEIRPLEPGDVHRHNELMNHAFARGRVVTPPEPTAEPQNRTDTLGLFEGTELRASATIEPFTVHWGAEKTLAMGGIAGVATFAEARGQGYIELLLRRSLEVMRDAGQTISSLYPFAFAFYKKQGWDWVGVRHSMKIPLAQVKSHPEGRRVVCLTGEDKRPRLEGAYTAFAHQYHGMFTAESHKWGDKLKHHDNRTTHIYLYEPTGEYFLWRYDDRGDEGQCREFIAFTPDGFRALLSVLHYLGTQCRVARIGAPANSPIWLHVFHWDLHTEAWPVFMGRVVDVASALQSLVIAPTIPNGKATVRISDTQAPWNEGLWSIVVEGGVCTCRAAIGGVPGGEPDVTVDIQTWSQAFWGTPSLRSLREAGRLTVGDEAAFAWLCQLLPGAPVYTLDDF